WVVFESLQVGLLWPDVNERSHRPAVPKDGGAVDVMVPSVEKEGEPAQPSQSPRTSRLNELYRRVELIPTVPTALLVAKISSIDQVEFPFLAASHHFLNSHGVRQ